MTTSPHLSAVLNITPNHLDRHGTLEAYAAAKARILEFQSGADLAVLSREDPGAWTLNRSVHGKLVTFGFERPEIGQAGTFIAGDHLYFTDGQMDQELMSCKLTRLRGSATLTDMTTDEIMALTRGR
jgi:UDP-N-acetylmuramoylalanine--D-glutamate ligase